MVKQNSTTDTQSDTQSDRELVITRVFNAPRDLVFSVWTEPKHIEQWWGPKGFTTRVEDMDFRSGGKWRYVMCGPDGTEYPGSGVFREIVPPERIVTTDEFDEEFEQVTTTDLPSGVMVVTASFEDLGNQTRLILRIMHATADDRRKHEAMGVVGGWNSSFDCLDEYLATMTESK